MTRPRIMSLCSGYGGLTAAVEEVTGGETVAFAEYDSDPSRILAHHWPHIPNLRDVKTIDWHAWAGQVDIIDAGFPCQDVSTAGKRAGLRPGTRTGIWTDIAYGISVIRPPLVLLENVGGILSAGAHSDMEPCPWCLGDADGQHALRALGAVLGDLATLGYDAQWTSLRAADVGAPHGRARLFIAAHPQGDAWRVGDGDCVPPRGAATPNAFCGGRDGRAPDPQRCALQRATAAGSGAGPGDTTPPDADGVVLDGSGRTRRRRGQPTDRSHTPTDADGDPTETVGLTVRMGSAHTVASGSELPVQWGVYEPAIRRWERVLGRPAPRPTDPGRGGRERLSPRFVEFLMGLPDGHVTAVPGLTRNAQLKALGNGVVPQQAAAAYRILLNHLATERAA